MSDEPIRAGDLRLLNKTQALERITELLKAEDGYCATITQLRADLARVTAERDRLQAIIRINALRWSPELTHEEIERVISGN